MCFVSSQSGDKCGLLWSTHVQTMICLQAWVNELAVVFLLVMPLAIGEAATGGQVSENGPSCTEIKMTLARIMRSGKGSQLSTTIKRDNPLALWEMIFNFMVCGEMECSRMEGKLHEARNWMYLTIINYISPSFDQICCPIKNYHFDG